VWLASELNSSSTISRLGMGVLHMGHDAQRLASPERRPW
jgi:hypothetical protein